jgi:hypothetical protein
MVRWVVQAYKARAKRSLNLFACVFWLGKYLTENIYWRKLELAVPSAKLPFVRGKQQPSSSVIFSYMNIALAKI